MFQQRELVNVTIAAAVAGMIYGPFAMPGNVNGLIVDALFTYGAGGTNLKAWLQTSFNNGVHWADVLCFAATTATKRRLAHIRSLSVTTFATPSDGTLADDTVVDGFLGGLWRVKLTTTGTYTGATALLIYAQPKL